MSDRTDYKRRAKQEKKVYFHCEIDHKHTPKKETSVSMWATITTETADKIKAFFKELESKGEI